MKKIRFYCGMGYVGCDREEIVEYPDTATEEEIDKGLTEWIFETIESCWEEVET